MKERAQIIWEEAEISIDHVRLITPNCPETEGLCEMDGKKLTETFYGATDKIIENAGKLLLKKES